jgi:hypothetical protein
LISSNPEEHLFVGYAGEDAEFARWITLRLTSEGYKVWCDQVKLLGGEPYPKDIRKAIRHSLFRFLAVISKYSIDKEMPLSERTLARRVGIERGIDDFIIPLNLDGSKAADLDLITSSITYVPFKDNWAPGLTQLLTKLQRISTPRTRPEGRQAVVSWLNTHQTSLEKKQERLWSNIIPITSFPKEVHRYFVTNIVKPSEDNWPVYETSRNVVWAFGPPGPDANVHARKQSRSTNWTTELEVGGVDTFHIASGILRQAMENYCVRKGMVSSQNGRDIYFPFGLFPKDKMPFRRFDGSVTSVKAVGKKTIRRITGDRETSCYHLAPVFQPLMNRFGDPCYQMNFRLVWTDEKGIEQKVPTGRRRLKWYNYEWLARTIAVLNWITDGNDSQNIFVGDNFSITIAGRPLSLASADRIKGDSLSKDAEADDENEEIDEAEMEEDSDEEAEIEDKNNRQLD